MDPTDRLLSHLWSPDLRTRHVKVYVFIFLWENHDVVRLRTAVESYTEPWSPGGNAFSQRPTVPNLDQDWDQRGGGGGGRGGGVLRFRSGWDFMYLAWNDPTRLSSDQTLSFPTCELINVTSAGTVVYSWTYLCPVKNLFSSNGLYFGSIEQ